MVPILKIGIIVVEVRRGSPSTSTIIFFYMEGDMEQEEVRCRYVSPDVHELRIKQVEDTVKDHTGRFEDLAQIPTLIQQQNILLADVKSQTSVVPQHDLRIALIEKDMKSAADGHDVDTLLTWKDQLIKWQDNDVKPTLEYVTKLKGERDFLRYVVPIIAGVIGSILGSIAPSLLKILAK